MSQSLALRWWTNKRVFWFAFWMFLFGLAFLFEHQRTYDRDAIYRVQSYRGYRGGDLHPVGKPRIESGDALQDSAIARIAVLRTLGSVALLAGAGGVVVMVRRLAAGESVLREVFPRR